jgi:hypothetical protein
MATAWLRSLFSSNRNDVQKSVNLFRNLLEDSRGTFRGTFRKDWESDEQEYVQGTFHVEHSRPFTHPKRMFQTSRCRSCKFVAIGFQAGVSCGQFKRAFQSRVCCKCEFVAIGGEGVACAW